MSENARIRMTEIPKEKPTEESTELMSKFPCCSFASLMISMTLFPVESLVVVDVDIRPSLPEGTARIVHAAEDLD